MSDQPDREQRDMEHRGTLQAWLTDYRKAFEAGDKMALLECVMFCAMSEIPLPRWALVEFARAAYAYTSRTSENFHDAIFGAALKPVGRHAQAATKRRNELEHQLWFDIVWALKEQGLKGDELYAQSIKEIGKGYAILLDGTLQFGDRAESACQPLKVPTAETLRKRFLRMRKAGARPRFAFAFMPCGHLPTRPASQ